MADLLINPNSANGIMTNVWGPPGWVFLHSVSFGYPMDPKAFDRANNVPEGTTSERYKNFFTTCGFVLPCKYCRDSYQQYIQEDPVDKQLANREALTRWLWRIHSRVNEKLGKPNTTYEEIVTRYESFRAKCDKKSKGCSVPVGNMSKQRTCVLIYSDLSVYVIVAVAIVVILVMLYVRTK
jgi:hypothetical protein